MSTSPRTLNDTEVVLRLGAPPRDVVEGNGSEHSSGEVNPADNGPVKSSEYVSWNPCLYSVRFRLNLYVLNLVRILRQTNRPCGQKVLLESSTIGNRSVG